MNHTHLSRLLAGAATLVMGSLVECEDYDPPPAVELRVADRGIWTKATPLEVVFSEAIVPESLAVTIWPNEVDIERELKPTAVPLIRDCTLATGPCGDAGFDMTLASDGRTVTITLGDAFDEVEGEPLLIEVHGGLRDMAGRTRAPSTFFDFQVTPSVVGGAVDVGLESGLFTLCADLAPTLPVWLRMIVDIEIDEETGRFVGIGTFVRAVGSAGANNCEPMFLKPDLSERGFAVAFTGLVSELGDSFFLQSDAKDFAVTIENLVSVVLADFQLSATIVPRPMSGAEQDLFSGTMVTSNAVLITDANEQEYGGLTRSWDGEGLDAEAIPEGIPRVCSNDPCATMGPAGGDCQMADWSRPAFCD